MRRVERGVGHELVAHGLIVAECSVIEGPVLSCVPLDMYLVSS